MQASLRYKFPNNCEVKEIVEGMTMKIKKMDMRNKDITTPSLRWGGDKWSLYLFEKMEK